MDPYIPFHHLEVGREYFVLKRNSKKYKGTFLNYKYSYLSGYERDIFAGFQNNNLFYFYTAEDKFYDVNYN